MTDISRQRNPDGTENTEKVYVLQAAACFNFRQLTPRTLLFLGLNVHLSVDVQLSEIVFGKRHIAGIDLHACEVWKGSDPSNDGYPAHEPEL